MCFSFGFRVGRGGWEDGGVCSAASGSLQGGGRVLRISWKLQLRLGGNSWPGFQCFGPWGTEEFTLVACVSLRLGEGIVWGVGSGGPEGENTNQWVPLKWK